MVVEGTPRWGSHPRDNFITCKGIPSASHKLAKNPKLCLKPEIEHAAMLEQSGNWLLVPQPNIYLPYVNLLAGWCQWLIFGNINPC